MHRGRRVGGAVLLGKVETEPEEQGKSNRVVGIVTPQVRPSMNGGQLLKHIHFGSSHKKDNERIKFLF